MIHVKQPQPPSNPIDGMNTFSSAIMSMALYLINSQSLEGVSKKISRCRILMDVDTLLGHFCFISLIFCHESIGM